MSHLVKILLSDSRLREFSVHHDKSLTSGIHKFVPFLKWVQTNGFKVPA